MDKKKYDVTIAGVEMSIISDEREDFVARLVAKLDEDINAIIEQNKRCSKLDAAILVALDTSGERIKAEKRVRNLEAQIALYDANLRRMREENIKLKSTLLGKNDGDFELKADDAGEDSGAGTDNTDKNDEAAEDGDDQRQLTMDIDEKQPENPTDAEENADDSRTGKEDKLRQIESLLRGRNS